jgi:tRNA threonylcarbamoyladenosine biosynthesis protein TsaB
MNLILINTCSLEGTVALAADTTITALETLPARATSEQLLPAIARLLPPPTRPDAIVVVNGPGSFTGIRAGLAAAKGLCEAWAVPLLAISRLALIANSLDSVSETVALLDAGRSEYYCGVYRGHTLLDEQLLRLDQVQHLLATRPGVTSDSHVASRVAETFSANVTLIEEPGPAAILALALDRIVAGQWSDVALTDANYLRRTDAELKHGSTP